MSAGDPKSGTGPQDNVPQEQVQTNPNWDTGGEKTPAADEQQRYWHQVSDENAHAGDAAPVTGTANAHAPSLIGGHPHNPTSYGALRDGLPASGATTDPAKKVDPEDHT
ncbi:hypothetical protein [Deinococcus budaensis]|uniref:Uncharacterized protein n=1 Tax=Deinococcus budaensis TaxID=1665626 RepID=A0A7W8GGE3_9DEIO|nr:hypothetical protein [Deinococcus budaensis]MBB5235152.1 hypothetical protein [Deinococcus budaensis]